jgi:hypothetical protein
MVVVAKKISQQSNNPNNKNPTIKQFQTIGCARQTGDVISLLSFLDTSKLKIALMLLSSLQLVHFYNGQINK